MKVDYTIQQVGPWPRDHTRDRATGNAFRCDWNHTIRILSDEVRKLQGPDSVTDIIEVVLGLAVRDADIRQDAKNIKEGARFGHPGILVAFPSRHGPLKFYCDHFVEWRHNVRGVALTLERLRMADLYGVTRRGEQYTGWKALPGPIVTAAPMSVDQAARFVATQAGNVDDTPKIVASADSSRRAYRVAAANLHPDANGGTARPEWARLQDAKRVLDQHHGVK